jgi:hypothetical protein
MQIPGSTGRGPQHNLYMVSTTHGKRQLPMMNSFSLDPTTKEETVYEMGTPFGILTVQFYEKFTFAMEATTPDNSEVPSWFMDTVPTSGQASVYAPHLTYQAGFSLFGNQAHAMTQKIFQGFVAGQCMGVMTTKQARDGSEMISIKGSGTQFFRVNPTGSGAGCAVGYTRGVAATPPYAATGDVTFAAAALTLPYTPVAWPLPGTAGNTQKIMYAIKNGIARNVAQDLADGVYSITGDVITMAVAPAATDVWEFFYPYIPA